MLGGCVQVSVQTHVKGNFASDDPFKLEHNMNFKKFNELNGEFSFHADFKFE